KLRDVTVNVAYRPHPDHGATGGRGSEDLAFILVEFGALVPDDPLIAQRMRSLLDANFSLLRSDAPIFACHPDSGDLVMQCVVALAEATSVGLFELIDDCVARALSWRHGDAFSKPPATLVGADFA